MDSPLPYRVDVHAHMLPPFYRQACQENGLGKPDGMPHLPEWSLEDHIKLMDKHNIKKSILSISSPGTNLIPGDSTLCAKLTRECNVYGADVKKRMPARIGYFAHLPLPDVEICLREIDLASQEGCDGFIMHTNGHGVYLGEPQLDPIFDELNRRQATLLIHPTTPMCPCSPEALAEGKKPVPATPFAGKFPNPMMEFLFDTARAVSNLFISGTIRRCPKIQIILPHLAGATPPLITRFAAFSSLTPTAYGGHVTEDEVKEAFQKQIWFDVAGFAFPSQIKMLMHGMDVPHSRLMYGSDYPFTQEPVVDFLSGEMEKSVKKIFDEEQIEDLCHRNAERLLSYPKVRV